jgi:hypothetical protein
MVIRHAERPDIASNLSGVSEAGAPDKNDLTVKGWRRAGALVRFFNPAPPGAPRSGLAVPGAVFAAPATDDNPSERPVHTVEALASDLSLGVQSQFALHQEKALVAAALGAAPVVLISWHHERIPKIAAELGVAVDPWPDGVFDRVLVFDSDHAGWKVGVIAQRLLPGDA